MYAKTIISTSFPLAWQWAVEFVRKSPEKISFGGGKEIKHAVDSQCTIILDEHAVRDVLNHVVHPSDPFATPNKLREYVSEYSDAYDASKFDYTYYDILKRGFFVTNANSPKGCFLNQIDILRDGLQKQVDENLSSNRNVAVLFNPVVNAHSNNSTPCWNEVLIRYIPSYHPGMRGVKIYNHFRSHDLGTAWEGNMVAMIEFLNMDVVRPCGCEIAEIIETNFSLHIYDYDLPAMNNIKTFYPNSALQMLQDKYDRISNSTIFDEFLESKGL